MGPASSSAISRGVRWPLTGCGSALWSSLGSLIRCVRESVMGSATHRNTRIVRAQSSIRKPDWNEVCPIPQGKLRYLISVSGVTMASGARAFGHPIHPTLIGLPLGLFVTAVVFDILRIITGNPTWSSVAFYMIAAGVIGGLVAAVFGLLDWLAITSG